MAKDPYPHPMEKNETARGRSLLLGTDHGPDGPTGVVLYQLFAREGESFPPMPQDMLCPSVHPEVTEAFLEACEAGKASFAISRLPMVANESFREHRERLRMDFERCRERSLRKRSVPEASREWAVDELRERQVEAKGSGRVCSVCADPMPAGKRGDAGYCSPRCRKRAWRERQREV